MKLMKMSCPNCGANLEIDTSNKEFLCKYCRTRILLDDEIIRVEHTVTDKDKEEKLKIARTYLYDFEDYNKAFEIYEQLSEKYPYEPEVWYGLVSSLTHNFFIPEESSKFPNIYECDNYFDKYIRIEKDNIKKEGNIRKYTEYKNKIKEKTSEYIGNYTEYEEEKEEDEMKDILMVFIVAILIISIIGLLFS